MQGGVIMKKMSTSEALIMRIIWEKKKELSSSEVHKIVEEEFPEMSWEAVTVSTFLIRLVEKKMLSYHVRGKAHYYYPLVSKEEYQSNLINEKIKKKMNMSMQELFLTFVGKEINQENIDKLNEMIEEWDK